MARISIIGANGFLGSHLVDALVREGHTVTAFDRFSGGQRRFTESPDNLIVGDFLNSEDLSKAVAAQDFVVHALSLTNPKIAGNSSTFDIEFNLKQSVRLIDIVSKSNVEHFYFASSGGTVYGDQKLEMYSESDATFPISPYGIGKLTVENYLRYFKVQSGLKSTSFRISNPYGPRQNIERGQGIIPITIDRVNRGLPAIMLGDGEMLRDYIYIDDLISDMVSLINTVNPQFDLYNLGSGTGHSVREIFSTIASCMTTEFEIAIESKPASFVERVVLDTSRVDSELGPRKRTTLEEGIALTVENFGTKSAI
jgi:UDP-glucose 4-epimerase